MPAIHFTLTDMMRAVTLLSLALGWLALVRSTPPALVLLVLALLGAALSLVIAVRRLGGLLARLLAGLGVFAVCLFVAIYSAGVAAAWSSSARQDASKLSVFAEAWAIFGFPFFIAAMVFLLRAWTWSAHDWGLRRELRGE